ncbi:WecB/TagA/CpsF family glycosyltransferase [Synechococcus sp. CS-1325]|uniref:WecB/TagA/CpsF family glycosyltransferase n=1 Tax=unclassified Synechococcus TaxID=2626047 RepID=UPI000DB81D69|nr:WecB/TagA/CpsF family glycosyltransferase [Synechococcus sp. CS-1325]MCT0212708.1 WecB/TagA/CpsF family glycosyltransferase [Synechococcus sp. CS-1326]MCT0233716.1 WecB/TagA/CpsF family glycosyltransferase [Synechococcus sp. CS-1327]PZV01286.1 MAG: glycosyl transferase [Cyanobium sp.]
MATESVRTSSGRSSGRSRVLGIPVDVCPDVFAAAIALQGRGGGQIVTLNAEMTMAAREDPALGAVMETAALVIPDGAGVVWALGLQGYRVRRSPGIELAHRLLSHAAGAGWRVALVGASPEVMTSLVGRLQREQPDLNLVLAVDGYQSDQAWNALERDLLAARPDLVLAALGVPRQEIWIQRLHQGQPGLWMGVGGSFDVWAGTKKRAPNWMGALQIEWLFRLYQEPHRWRRMLSLPAFAWDVIRSGENPLKRKR